MSRFAPAVRRLHFPSWAETRERFRLWLEKNASTWAISTIVHVVLLLIAMLVLSRIVQRPAAEPPMLIAALPEDDSPPPIFSPGTPQVEPPPIAPPPITPPLPTDFDEKPAGQKAIWIDDSLIFSQKGDGGAENILTGPFHSSFDARGLGPKLLRGNDFGGGPFGPRNSGHQMFIDGRPKEELAAKAALSWLARHQNADGSWSMDHGRGTLCRDTSCTGPALAKSDPGATALALLPFLAYGQTQVDGEYKTQIGKGLIWLVKHQKADGDLSTGGDHPMYAHGLAAIALCEAYGMTHDSKLAISAQHALKFIETAQNAQGGWRYTPGTPESDLSVFGWQVMALKSGQMAGLAVDAAVLDRARAYLRTVGTGGGGFSYTAGGGIKNSMTAVGVLTAQYLGATRDDPLIRDGVAYLMNHLPDTREADIYYWYYATQAMHNLPGPEWQTWNRAMRRVLTETQTRPVPDKTAAGKTATDKATAAKLACATGSWNPDPDSWGAQGGRLMVTSLSCLTLEVYYRYTPLFKLDAEGEEK